MRRSVDCRLLVYLSVTTMSIRVIRVVLRLNSYHVVSYICDVSCRAPVSYRIVSRLYTVAYRVVLTF
jgi:hypothetical protein